MSNKEKLRNAEKLTERHPTEKQKETGRYKKGKVRIKGLPIAVENPKGSIREGVDESGKAWRTKMLYTYGYFTKTIGKDGDPIDVFIGPEIDNDFDVYIIDQVMEEHRKFDEHKVMFGFASEKEARKAYKESYTSNWKGFENITTLSLTMFKRWISNPQSVRYPAARLRQRSKMDFANIGNKESRIKNIALDSEVFEGKTLSDLQNQAGSKEEYDILVLEIASPGGSVSEGLEIMLWLESLKSSGKKVVTIVTGNAYSIASLIMLSANVKIISCHGKVMVHNPMVPELKYVNAKDLEKHASELRELENLMYEMYQGFTGIEQIKIKELMDSESYLSPEQAIQYGFADKIVNIKKRPYVEAVNKQKDINMSKAINILNRIIAKVNVADFVNQLYYDTDGGELEIYQTDPSTYAIGDKASVEDGLVKLADGATLTIEGGEIKEIDRAEAPEAAVTEEEVPAEAAEFNEGPAPKEVMEEEVKEEVAAVEEEVKVEEVAAVEEEVKVEEVAEEVIEAAPIAPVEVAPIAPEMPATPNVEAMEEDIREKEMKALNTTIDGLKKVVSELKTKVGNLEAISKEIISKDVATEKFKTVATEAIDTLAKNTSSVFAPEAVKKNEVQTGGSIFSKLKAQAEARAK